MLGGRCFSSLKSAVQGCIRHGHPARQSNAPVYNYSRRVLSTGNKPVDNAAEKSPVSFASLALMAITGGAVALYFNTQKEERLKEVSKNVTSVGKPALGGPFALVDIHGQPKTDVSYQGKFALLYFGFTHCPDICPSELVKIGKVMDLLGKAPWSCASLSYNVSDAHSCRAFFSEKGLRRAREASVHQRGPEP